MSEALSVLPEDLEPTERGVLQGHGRIALAFARWEHAAPKGRVVIAHGYGEHGERYRHVASWLHGLGWSVSSFDHRGFGRSGGRRGDAEGIRAYVDDLVHFLRQERRRDAERAGVPPRVVDGVPLPPRPVHPQVLLGHSFGGLVGLLALLWHADTMEGLVLCSPALQLRPFPWRLRLLHRLMAALAPHATLDLPHDKTEVCSDPVFVQRYWSDPLCHHRVSAAFLALFPEGRGEVLHLGHELERPVLLLEAGADTLVDPDASEVLWASVRPELLERHRLEGFRHEVLHDRRRREVQPVVEAWLLRILEAGIRNPTPPSAMRI